MKKSEIISMILNNKANKKKTSDNADYVRAIYRKVFCDDEKSKQSVMKRNGKDYRWFEVYFLDENDLKFKKKEFIELYIDKVKFAEGHFHEVRICK
jgi:hypothetical protein